MARRYKEIVTDAECRLVMADCDCDGFDIIETVSKEPPLWQRLAACKCGKRRGRCKPQGGWSVVIDESTYAPISVSGQPEG